MERKKIKNKVEEDSSMYERWENDTKYPPKWNLKKEDALIKAKKKWESEADIVKNRFNI